MVNQVIMGNVYESLDHNIARVAAVKCGLPFDTPAFTIGMACSSGMQAIISGFQVISRGDVDVVVAGGVESMSNAPYVLTTARWGQRLQHGQLTDSIWKVMQEYCIGVGMGLLSVESLRRLEALLHRAKLPTRAKKLCSREVMEALRVDKKAREGRVFFVLPQEIGKVCLRDDVPPGLLREVVEELII